MSEGHVDANEVARREHILVVHMCHVNEQFAVREYNLFKERDELEQEIERCSPATPEAKDVLKKSITYKCNKIMFDAEKEVAMLKILLEF
jgi:hypothetical protein